MSATGNNRNQGTAGMANLVNRYAGLQPNNQYSGMPSGNDNFGNQGFIGDSGGGYPGMAQGPYSNVGNMMMGRNPYQQYFGGGYQGMYNNGSQPPQQQVNPDWYKTTSAQNPTATPGQTAFPGVDMNTGQLLGSTPQTSFAPQPQTSFTPQTQTPTTTSRFANDPYAGIDPVTGQMVFK